MWDHPTPAAVVPMLGMKNTLMDRRIPVHFNEFSKAKFRLILERNSWQHGPVSTPKSGNTHHD